MANIRRGFGDDLTLKNGNLGINTTTAQERVDVVGVVKGQDLYTTGVSSLTAYEGFLRADNQIVESTTLEFGQGLKSSLSGEIIVGTGVTVTIGIVGLGTAEVGVGSTSGADGKTASNIDTTDINLAGGSQIECLKIYNTFTPPNGGTNERPYAPKPGELYYNYDFKTIEFHDGYGWRQVDNTTRSGRMLIGGNGDQTIHTGLIQSVSIPALGEFTTFGDLSQARDGVGGGGNETRAVFFGGATNPGGGNTTVDTIDYNTIASGGTGIDFGNLTGQATRYPAVCSSSTRATAAVDDGSIFYVETSTLGNALDGGNIFDTDIARLMAGAQSPTRGYHFGGFEPGPVNHNQISSFSLASMGKAIRFGDLLNGASTYNDNALSNTTRAVLASESDTHSKHIAYITMTTEGVASYFGDLSSGGRGQASSTQVRGVIAHRASPGDNITEYITIPTGGNGISFGELSTPQNSGGCTSDSHGGLGGF